MLYNDFTTKILGIKEAKLIKIETFEKTIILHIQLNRHKHNCPCCLQETSRVHDYRVQKIKDLPILDKDVFLMLRKRRYKCLNCGKQFYEKVSFMPKYYRMTYRVIGNILEDLRETCSFSSVARRMKLSTPTVIRMFDVLSYPQPKLPKVLAIDEFKGNTGGEKYNAIITDPATRIVLDILPKRHESYLIDYFKKKNRQDVEYFISDMWKPYRQLSENFFKKATFIVDRYHFVRQVSWAFENVRKEEQKRLGKTYTRSFKRSKRILSMPFKHLSKEDKQEVNVMLKISPKLHEAHVLKESFFELLEEPDPHKAKLLLSQWIIQAQEYELPQFAACTKAFANWSKGICNSFDHRYSNGFTEGCNNKIKVLKRNAYGYKNFSRFRNRILHIFNDKNIQNAKLQPTA